MGLLAWIVLGLVAGLIARPGPGRGCLARPWARERGRMRQSGRRTMKIEVNAMVTTPERVS
jgi:hypothetical protein